LRDATTCWFCLAGGRIPAAASRVPAAPRRWRWWRCRGRLSCWWQWCWRRRACECGCRDSDHLVGGVSTPVFDFHAMPASSLEHLCPELMISGCQLFLRTSSSSPTMKTIIVHHLLVINPHLTAIIRKRLELVVPSCLDVQQACPLHGIVVFVAEPGPRLSGILVVW